MHANLTQKNNPQPTSQTIAGFSGRIDPKRVVGNDKYATCQMLEKIFGSSGLKFLQRLFGWKGKKGRNWWGLQREDL